MVNRCFREAPEAGIFCRVSPPKRLFLPWPALRSFHLTHLILHNFMTWHGGCNELRQPPAWESLRRTFGTVGLGRARPCRTRRGDYRCRMHFSSDCHARSRSRANSTWSPTTSRTSTPPATKPTARCSRNFCPSAARADQTGSRVSFVRDRGIWHDMSAGPVEHTGNPLDVAVDGNGFLVVQTPRGERYTRNGSLQINPTGQLVTSDGYPVIGDGGPITLQPTDRQVSISRDGTISVREGTSKIDSRAASCSWSPSTDRAAIAERRQQHLQPDRRRAAASRQRRRRRCRAPSKNPTCAASSRCRA